ncbi:hemin uptake protein HemP [Undibacterium sp. CY18W]|uniref:Hemin uptake protein HemP n=1 Tax=Undibacterium hunanense TaxID=2762292 RepID=A0ABR6ZYZ4_9BURK|nr:hemin uptake protein HemP [Undibacterium hunanense]MBC3921080.1 hemin uptake protein HemP [Undibacterium hunanense]
MSTNDAIQELKPGSVTIAVQQQKVIPRLKSAELMQHKREVEIDHEGRIYRLRITQLNKLILTA